MLVVGLLVAAASFGEGPAGAAAPGPSSLTPVAAATVRPCPGLRGVRCGSIRVPRYWHAPSDPADALTVRFRIYGRTARSQPALEPVVAFEGGPGYGSIDSANSYLKMLGPLRRRHDLIVMDQRGTGRSDVIDCPALQRGTGNYVDAVAACAHQLGGAANAYGSAAAADDLAAILGQLGIDRVDLYGDSYGTYLAQVFVLHHPDLVRALVLDGAYDQSFDPFARDASAALRRAWKVVCRRAGTCSGILHTFGSFARRLDTHPIVGVPPGASRPVRLTARGFAQMVYDATYVFTISRDLPAAIEASEAGDDGPILRLTAEDVISTGNGGDPSAYSAGLYMAVACHDYPTIWDRMGSTAERRTQLRAAIDQLAPGAFAPFRTEAWLASLYEHQLVYGCLRWPRPSVPDPAFPSGLVHPDTPVLVLNGELDITTPFADARRAARAFPNATLVKVRNELHVSALYDFQDCAQRIARRFLRTLGVGDTSCAREIPRVDAVAAFPQTLATAPGARSAGHRDRSNAVGRRVAWVATQTVADAFSRWYNVTYRGGRGPRGGTFDARGPYLGRRPLELTFHGSRFVVDLAVSGIAVWDRHAFRVRADLTCSGAASGRLIVTFPTRAEAPVRIRGVVDGRRVDLRMPGPPFAS